MIEGDLAPKTASGGVAEQLIFFRLNGFEFRYTIHGVLQPFYNVPLSNIMIIVYRFCKSCKLLLLRMESPYISEVSEIPL